MPNSKLKQNIAKLIDFTGPEQFAVRVGVSYYTVRDWLDPDKGVPNLENLMEISAEFGVTLEELVNTNLDTTTKRGK